MKPKWANCMWFSWFICLKVWRAVSTNECSDNFLPDTPIPSKIYNSQNFLLVIGKLLDSNFLCGKFPNKIYVLRLFSLLGVLPKLVLFFTVNFLHLMSPFLSEYFYSLLLLLMLSKSYNIILRLLLPAVHSYISDFY